MSQRLDEMRKELNGLVSLGNHLYIALADDAGQIADESRQKLATGAMQLPNFTEQYEMWYTAARRVVQQILPERLDDFVRHYKNEKRKEVDVLTYTISDALLGLRTMRFGEVRAGKAAALPKLLGQVKILEAARLRFDSSLFDITEVLLADLFDSELDAAEMLAKKGFVRAAGAIAGVVLEKHLARICSQHNLKARKRNPSLSDWYQLLKETEVIDVPTWRFIQHLADVRNLCDHAKDREPATEAVVSMVIGVKKVTKTVF